MRVAFGIEYDGTRYCGWQLQPHCPSLQAAVETALSSVADHPVRVHSAGRTDTGVHATGQVVHIDTHAERQARSWVLGANANLPPDVSVCWAKPVDEAFHARFSAQGRSYRYFIYNRSARCAIAQGRTALVYRALDVERMREGAQHLLGTHDFTSFRARECQARSPVRTVRRLEVERRDHFIIISVDADGFLHHMVRNIVGVLMSVGDGSADPAWVKAVLSARDRAAGGLTAPAAGLYLTRVQYAPEFEIPEPAAGPLLL